MTIYRCFVHTQFKQHFNLNSTISFDATAFSHTHTCAHYSFTQQPDHISFRKNRKKMLSILFVDTLTLYHLEKTNDRLPIHRVFLRFARIVDAAAFAAFLLDHCESLSATW